MIKKISFILSLCIILYTLVGCEENYRGQIIEYHDNGKAATVLTKHNQEYDSMCFKEYYPSGKLKRTYCGKDKEPEGLFIEFQQDGSKSYECTFQDGKRNGFCISYDYEGRKVDKLEYYHDDRRKYRCLIDGEGRVFEEKYNYDFSLFRDTLSLGYNEAVFEVSLLLPDSIFREKEIYFAYQLKSFALRDSIILHPKDSIRLTNSTVIKGSVKVDEFEDQLFYGHLTFNDSIHEVQYPVERVMYVKK